MPRAVGGYKVCSRADCEFAGIAQPTSNFFRSKAQSDGLLTLCKSCSYRHQTKWRLTHKSVVRAYRNTHGNKGHSDYVGLRNSRAHFLWSRYRLRPDDYLSMFSGQCGTCAICCDALPTLWTACVDHCHDTGATRGLLCRQCNTGLGHFRERADILARATAYLSRSVKSAGAA